MLRDAHDLAPYTVDLLKVYGARPRFVVRPGNTEEVAAAVACCAEAGVAMVPFGGNTGFCGGSMAKGDHEQVIIALGRMNRIRWVDPAGDTIGVDAGCVLATARAAAEAQGRLLPLSHGGEGSSEIGGNLGTNAGGLNVLRYGMARELVLGLEVVLPDGRVLDMMRTLRKDNTGYDLKQLFVGTEGTLGIITGAVLKLFPLPRRRETAFVAVTSTEGAVELLGSIRAEVGSRMSAFELVPRRGLDLVLAFDAAARDPLESKHAWYVLMELEGEGLQPALEKVMAEGLVVDAVLAQSEAQRAALWRMRENLAVAQVAERSTLKNDTAVPIGAIPEFIRRASAAVETLAPGVRPVPFGHIGDGNIHFNMLKPEALAPDAFIALWPALVRAVEDVALALGGSVSAEHGIGQSKREALRRARSAVELDLMHAIKQALDPKGLMNPGKIL